VGAQATRRSERSQPRFQLHPVQPLSIALRTIFWLQGQDHVGRLQGPFKIAEDVVCVGLVVERLDTRDDVLGHWSGTIKEVLREHEKKTKKAKMSECKIIIKRPALVMCRKSAISDVQTGPVRPPTTDSSSQRLAK